MKHLGSFNQFVANSTAAMGASAFSVCVAFTLAGVLPAGAVSNTSLYWDANGGTTGTGGSGTWDTSTSLWRLSSTAGTLQAYTNSAGFMTANLGGTAGTVTIAGSAVINANLVRFSATGYTVAGGSGSTLNLDGTTPTIASGAGNTATISANITGSAGLSKDNDNGTLILAGANSYTGNTVINGGTLVLDMNAGGSLATTGALNMGAVANSGTFQVKGKDGIASSQTLGLLIGGVQATFGKIVLTAGAGVGSSVNLALDSSAAWTRSGAGFTLNVDTSGGNATLAMSNATFLLQNGIVGSNSAGGSGWVTVTDAVGTGFATIDGASHMVRYTGATALPAGATLGATNYVTKVGDAAYSGNTLTLTGARNANTLQLDSSGGSGILNLGGFTLGFTNRGLLMTGSNDYTIQTGQLGAAAAEVIFHHYGTGALTVNSTITSGAGRLTKDGPGLLIVNGTNTYTGNTALNGGTLRITDGVGLPNTGVTATSSQLTISNGVLETGADFVRVLGSSGPKIMIVGGSSGFSAYGGPVNIAVGGLATPTALLYGAGTSFNPAVFVLNESSANNTLDFKNALDLAGAVRAINVNSSAYAATLSGVLSNSGGSAAGIAKGGVGTLILANTNTYNGPTIVNAGTLAVTGSTAATSAVTVGGASAAGSPTLAGTGTANGAVTISAASGGAAGTVNPGTVGGVGSLHTGATTIAGSYACDINGAASDLLAVTGSLTLTGATLASTAVAPTASSYTIATYTTGTVPAFTTVTGVPIGYALDYSTAHTIQLVQTSVDAYTSWIDTPAFGLSGAQKDKTADPDGDGLTNSTEFALDGNPASGAASGKVISKIASVGSNPTLVLTLPVRAGATFSLPGAPTDNQLVSAAVNGLIYQIQGSNDLATWTQAVSEVTGSDKTAIESGLPALSSTDWTYRTFASAVPVAGNPKEFLRAVIVSTP